MLNVPLYIYTPYDAVFNHPAVSQGRKSLLQKMKSKLEKMYRI